MSNGLQHPRQKKYIYTSAHLIKKNASSSSSIVLCLIYHYIERSFPVHGNEAIDKFTCPLNDLKGNSCSGAGEFSQVLKMNGIFFSLQTALCIYVVLHTTLEANEEEIGKVAKKQGKTDLAQTRTCNLKHTNGWSCLPKSDEKVCCCAYYGLCMQLLLVQNNN